MAVVLLFAAVDGGPDWLAAFLAVTAVAQTVLLAWLAKVPRWGAPGAVEERKEDKRASEAGRRRRVAGG